MFYPLAVVPFSFLLSCVQAIPTSSHSLVSRSPHNSKTAIASLWAWDWRGVQDECPFVASAGYGYVQVSTSTEHIRGPQWWTDYQVVSYDIISKRGNRAEFKSMIDACHNVGVKVIVDVVINHMTALDSGTGIAGHNFTHYDYPGIYDYNDFHHCGTPGDEIHNFQNETQLETCQLVNLADLNTESERVRKRLAQHANDLIGLGADGLRIDAAKHISPASINNILSRLSRPVYITQEIVDTTGKWIALHTAAGKVQEFRYAWTLKSAFITDGISSLRDLNDRGLINSNGANVFVASHDTERLNSTLTYQSNHRAYILAHVFTESDAGAPSGGHCSGDGPTSGWECQHRWPEVTGMLDFYNRVGESKMNHWVTGTNQQIAFGRGSIGYVVINNDGSIWDATFSTSLPDGKYCDIVGGLSTAEHCPGMTITVTHGSFTASVPAYHAIALHVGRKH
ncbi:glycoside hydrolase family 13 protein [Hydnum rufescens UP504]|uniref:Alpha-amylase n=1 Tax=Hydnum rufescens UP504 TaxID=1448309 RepID=A0A9P6DSV2_9AGAM|nr:glycoside hydrolase family 13 protein [Hydnum rufescens UP504]